MTNIASLKITFSNPVDAFVFYQVTYNGGETVSRAHQATYQLIVNTVCREMLGRFPSSLVLNGTLDGKPLEPGEVVIDFGETPLDIDDKALQRAIDLLGDNHIAAESSDHRAEEEKTDASSVLEISLDDNQMNLDQLKLVLTRLNRHAKAMYFITSSEQQRLRYKELVDQRALSLNGIHCVPGEPRTRCFVLKFKDEMTAFELSGLIWRALQDLIYTGHLPHDFKWTAYSLDEGALTLLQGQATQSQLAHRFSRRESTLARRPRVSGREFLGVVPAAAAAAAASTASAAADAAADERDPLDEALRIVRRENQDVFRVLGIQDIPKSRYQTDQEKIVGKIGKNNYPLQVKHAPVLERFPAAMRYFNKPRDRAAIRGWEVRKNDLMNFARELAIHNALKPMRDARRKLDEANRRLALDALRVEFSVQKPPGRKDLQALKAVLVRLRVVVKAHMIRALCDADPRAAEPIKKEINKTLQRVFADWRFVRHIEDFCDVYIRLDLIDDNMRPTLEQDCEAWLRRLASRLDQAAPMRATGAEQQSDDEVDISNVEFDENPDAASAAAAAESARHAVVAAAGIASSPSSLSDADVSALKERYQLKADESINAQLTRTRDLLALARRVKNPDDALTRALATLQSAYDIAFAASDAMTDLAEPHQGLLDALIAHQLKIDTGDGALKAGDVSTEEVDALRQRIRELEAAAVRRQAAATGSTQSGAEELAQLRRELEQARSQQGPTVLRVSGHDDGDHEAEVIINPLLIRRFTVARNELFAAMRKASFDDSARPVMDAMQAFLSELPEHLDQVGHKRRALQRALLNFDHAFFENTERSSLLERFKVTDCRTETGGVDVERLDQDSMRLLDAGFPSEFVASIVEIKKVGGDTFDKSWTAAMASFRRGDLPAWEIALMNALRDAVRLSYSGNDLPETLATLCDILTGLAKSIEEALNQTVSRAENAGRYAEAAIDSSNTSFVALQNGVVRLRLVLLRRHFLRVIKRQFSSDQARCVVSVDPSCVLRMADVIEGSACVKQVDMVRLYFVPLLGRLEALIECGLKGLDGRRRQAQIEKYAMCRDLLLRLLFGLRCEAELAKSAGDVVADGRLRTLRDALAALEVRFQAADNKGLNDWDWASVAYLHGLGASKDQDCLFDTTRLSVERCRALVKQAELRLDALDNPDLNCKALLSGFFALLAPLLTEAFSPLYDARDTVRALTMEDFELRVQDTTTVLQYAMQVSARAERRLDQGVLRRSDEKDLFRMFVLVATLGSVASRYEVGAAASSDHEVQLVFYNRDASNAAHKGFTREVLAGDLEKLLKGDWVWSAASNNEPVLGTDNGLSAFRLTNEGMGRSQTVTPFGDEIARLLHETVNVDCFALPVYMMHAIRGILYRILETPSVIEAPPFVLEKIEGVGSNNFMLLARGLYRALDEQRRYIFTGGKDGQGDPRLRGFSAIPKLTADLPQFAVRCVLLMPGRQVYSDDMRRLLDEFWACRLTRTTQASRVVQAAASVLDAAASGDVAAASDSQVAQKAGLPPPPTPIAPVASTAASTPPAKQAPSRSDLMAALRGGAALKTTGGTTDPRQAMLARKRVEEERAAAVAASGDVAAASNSQVAQKAGPPPPSPPPVVPVAPAAGAATSGDPMAALRAAIQAGARLRKVDEDPVEASRRRAAESGGGLAAEIEAAGGLRDDEAVNRQVIEAAARFRQERDKRDTGRAAASAFPPLDMNAGRGPVDLLGGAQRLAVAEGDTPVLFPHAEGFGPAAHRAAQRQAEEQRKAEEARLEKEKVLRAKIRALPSDQSEAAYREWVRQSKVALNTLLDMLQERYAELQKVVDTMRAEAQEHIEARYFSDHVIVQFKNLISAVGTKLSQSAKRSLPSGSAVALSDLVDLARLMGDLSQCQCELEAGVGVQYRPLIALFRGENRAKLQRELRHGFKGDDVFKRDSNWQRRAAARLRTGGIANPSAAEINQEVRKMLSESDERLNAEALAAHRETAIDLFASMLADLRDAVNLTATAQARRVINRNKFTPSVLERTLATFRFQFVCAWTSLSDIFSADQVVFEDQDGRLNLGLSATDCYQRLFSVYEEEDAFFKEHRISLIEHLQKIRQQWVLLFREKTADKQVAYCTPLIQAINDLIDAYRKAISEEHVARDGDESALQAAGSPAFQAMRGRGRIAVTWTSPEQGSAPDGFVSPKKVLLPPVRPRRSSHTSDKSAGLPIGDIHRSAGVLGTPDEHMARSRAGSVSSGESTVRRVRPADHTHLRPDLAGGAAAAASSVTAPRLRQASPARAAGTQFAAAARRPNDEDLSYDPRRDRFRDADEADDDSPLGDAQRMLREYERDQRRPS